MRKQRLKGLKYLAHILILVLIISCAGNKPKPDWSPTQYFEYAKKKFEEEDYFEAANEFTVVTLRYAGSSVADSAQYFLAESHFNMDEHLIAAAEYEKLIKNMSRSPLVPKAMFKMAESYYRLSPRPALDQEYTFKAIRNYQLFIEEYPNHSLKEKAEKRIAELRNKLAKKKYSNAEIYRKMHEYRAAILYYDQLLNEYYDTDWADDAMFGKIQALMELEDYTKASKEIEKFKSQFAYSDLLNKVKDAESDLPE